MTGCPSFGNGDDENIKKNNKLTRFKTCKVFGKSTS